MLAQTTEQDHLDGMRWTTGVDHQAVDHRPVETVSPHSHDAAYVTDGLDPYNAGPPPGPPPPQNRYGDAPPPAQNGDDRLEQARKVQQVSDHDEPYMSRLTCPASG